jgi:hypothetical protein
MLKIKELKEQRTKLLLDRQKLVTKTDVNKEERAQSSEVRSRNKRRVMDTHYHAGLNS